MYELSKAFNQFYHDHSVLNEPDKKTSVFRLMISVFTSNVIKNAMHLLGIDVPERM
ncbi:MAG: DALR anticodon-binding domain-containing protein [Bacteroidota bacterium]